MLSNYLNRVILILERMDVTDNYKETDDDLNSISHTVDKKQFKRDS